MSDEHRKVITGPRQFQKRVKRQCESVLKDTVETSEWQSFCDEVVEPSPHTHSETLALATIQPVASDDGLLIRNEDLIIEDGCDIESSNQILLEPSGSIDAPCIPSCSFFSDSDSNSSSSTDDDSTETANLCVALQKWYLDSKANIHQLDLLLSALRPFHPDLPKSGRTVVKTPSFTDVKEFNNGTYVHFGIEKSLKAKLKFGMKGTSKKIELDINVDGLQLSKSSQLVSWPILGRSFQLRDQKPFIIGLFCGQSKPDPLESFLQDYINDVQHLLLHGLPYEEECYEIGIRSYICDAPARQYLECIKSHNGYNCCERCLESGEHGGKRMCFEPKVSTLRTEESFRNMDDDAHHHKESPLAVLPTKFIQQFPLDPFHLVLHGVMKQFLQFLMGKSRTNAKLDAASINEISVNLEKLQKSIPSDFARKPRSLAHLGRWKGTEHRLFLLYVGAVVLRTVDIALYRLFLLFHCACRIVSTPSLVSMKEYIDYAEELFSTFIRHCAEPTVFGPSFVVYNVHSLLHLCDDVRHFGDLNTFSTTPFENHLGIIKRMVGTGVRVPQQIARRLAEIDSFESSSMSIQDDLPYLLSPQGYDESTRQYKSLQCINFKLTPSKKKESYFRNGGSVGRLKEIKKENINGKLVLTADICDDIEDFYTYPVQCSMLGIFKINKWTAQNVNVEISAIAGKMMVLPFGNSEVAMQILHTC